MYTDHFPSISNKVLNKRSDIKNMLEIGCGLGTGMYLDAGLNVTSLEIVQETAPRWEFGSEWYEKCVELYGNNDRWDGHLIYYPDGPVNDLELHIRENEKEWRRPYKTFDPSHEIILELISLVEPWLDKEWDLVLIDGTRFRGEYCRIFWPTTKVLCYHDRHAGHGLYGWRLLGGIEGVLEREHDGHTEILTRLLET